jgi:hypothetical protein
VSLGLPRFLLPGGRHFITSFVLNWTKITVTISEQLRKSDRGSEAEERVMFSYLNLTCYEKPLPPQKTESGVI